MKLKFRIGIFMLFIFSQSFTQIPLKNPFKEQAEPNSKILSYTFQVMVEKLNDTLYIRKEFNASSKQLTSYVTYKSLEPVIKHGLSYEKWDDGDVFQKGYYHESKKVGFWMESDEEGFYENGLKVGEWKSNQNTNRGYRIVNYKNGRKNGETRYLDSLGNVLQVGIYENDSLITGFEMRIADEMPVFKGCESLKTKEERSKCSPQKLLEFLHKNIKYPKSVRNKEIQGQAIVKFLKSEDGKISDLKVKRGLCDEIKENIEEVFALMPKWTPGIQENKNVKVQYILPLKFNLK